MLSPEKRERFQKEPAQAIQDDIREFVRTSPLNRMPSTREHVVFDRPLVRFADGDDSIYQ